MSQETTAQTTTETVSTDNVQDVSTESAGVEESQTFTLTEDELNDKLQRYADQHLSKSRNTIIENERVKWETEKKAELEEAKRVAEMSTEQVLEHEREKLQAERERLLQKEKEFDLRRELESHFSQNGIDPGLIAIVQSGDFETSLSKLEAIQAVIDKKVEENNNNWLAKGGKVKTSGGSQGLAIDTSNMSPLDALKAKRENKE